MLTHEDYTVGWISALPLEMRAARAVLEETHPHLPQRPTDSNSYILGAIGGHNVVIACLPYGVYGTTSAASVLTNMMASFPNLEFALMVGIGGGVPGTAVDVRLGDIVVSKPTGIYGGVVQYDYGKVVSGRGFQQTGALNQPPQVLLTSIAQLQADRLAATAQEKPLCDILSRAFERSPELKRGFASPGRGQDQLFVASYRHVEAQEVCDMCDKDQTVKRSERDPSSEEPKVHYGLIASGNQVMKDAEIRDQLAKKFDIICFEMEAAGLMNQIPCLVIRGICDYSDSHKNKIWQGYAALTAAAYAKLLLSVVPVPSPSRAEKKKDLSTEEKACLRALVLTDPADDMNALKRRRGERVPGTCNWIIETDDVRRWLGLLPETAKTDRKTSADILWLFGNPGTGKSTIATAMVEELPKQPSFQRKKSNNRTLAYFFCDSTIEERRTATAILRGLLYQLIQQRPELIRFVYSKYEERGDKLFTSFDALWNALLQIGRDSSSGEKYLLIDALDECELESQVMLLAQISQTFDSERNSNCGIHFLITSRPYPEIGRYLGEYSQKDLASYPKVARDLQMFINRRLGEISKKNRYPESVITEVSRILQEKAQGTFLWVGIACTELILVRSRDVIKRLNALPQGLHSLYKNLLDTAFDNDEENESILQMLSFIATSRRALTVAELADACERYNDEDDESRIAFTREDIEMCRLMIVVENGIVRLLHKSVKDFLLSARDGTLLDVLKVHATLASRCISHLVANSAKDAFMNYAVLHWPEHAALAKKAFTIATEQETFFELTSKERDNWLSLYRRMRIFSGVPDGFSVFHVAARWGIEEVARFALDCIGKRPDNHYYHDDEFRASNAGTPLQEAAKRGNLPVMTILSNARAPGSVFTERIWVAAASNEENGVEILPLLLTESENNSFQIPEAVVYAAAANRGCGTAILSRLLQQSNLKFLVADMVRAAAKNRTNGKTIIQLYLNTLDRDSFIGVDFIAALIRYFDVEVIKLLTDRCGNDQIEFTKSGVSALSHNHRHGQHIMAFLMDQKEANHTQLLTSFLEMNIKEWRNAEKLLKVLFHPTPRKIRVQKETAVGARQNQAVGEEMLEMLLDLPENHLLVDADAFTELCRTFDAQVVGRVFLEHGNGQIEVTEAVIEAACSNQRHAEPLVGLFLEHINSITGIEFTDQIATAAATNQRSKRILLKRLLAHPKIKLTWQGASRVVLYGDPDIVQWFSQSQAGDPALRVTAQAISDAAAASRGLGMLTLLMAPLAVKLEITGAAVARFFEIYDQTAVESFIRLRGDLVCLTGSAIKVVCSKFGFQTISLLLEKQRSRGPLENTDVWKVALYLNATMSHKERFVIMKRLSGEPTVGDYPGPATLSSDLEKLFTDEQVKRAWEGPDTEVEKNTLLTLPLELMRKVVSSLGYRDYVHLSRACRMLYVRMRKESLAQIIFEKDLAHTGWGSKLAKGGGPISYRRTIGAFHDTTRAFAAGWPYAAIVLAKADHFIYNEGYLFYLWRGDIRVLHVHSLASIERVLTMAQLVIDIVENPTVRDYDITLLFYGKGVLSMDIYLSEVKERWLVSLSISVDSTQKPRVLFRHQLNSPTAGLFVRNDESHCYYGSFAKDLPQWEIHCIDMNTGDLVTQVPLLLDGLVPWLDEDDPTFASFKLYKGHLYALVPQEEMVSEDKSYISSHAWTLLSPTTRQSETRPRRVWRSQISAPAPDIFLESDYFTQRPYIVECHRRQGMARGKGVPPLCFRHPLPAPDEINGHSDNLFPPIGSRKGAVEVTFSVEIGNEAAHGNSVRLADRRLLPFQLGCPDTIDMRESEELESTMTVSSAYKSYPPAYIEFVNNQHKIAGSLAEDITLYLRTIALQEYLPEREGQDVDTEPQEHQPATRAPLPAPFVCTHATQWPSSKGMPNMLREVLSPLGHTQIPQVVVDDRSIIYSVRHPKTQEQQVVLLSFDPTIGFTGLQRFTDVGPMQRFHPLSPALLTMYGGAKREGRSRFFPQEDLAALLPAVRNEIPLYMRINRGFWVR